ncbi:MAG: PQQ-dependent dehydrogenase, methanol/ethanol family [Acidobacteria bacterium]|nr:PQQ-dependent dehydrogenase, methanol/ethanol family [Acidobacteriota bacterium]
MRRLTVTLLLLVLAASCKTQREDSQAPGASKGSGEAKAMMPAFTTTANEDGQWLSVQKDYANTRFSGLKEINLSNVDKLKAATTFSTGFTTGHEATPLVVGDTMYLVTPFPNVLYALDLKQPGGATKWVYQPKPDPAAQGVACCDVVNRGEAYADGKVIINTLDNHTIAVSAATGEEIWNTKLGDINRGETITMAPFVVKDKVLVGNSGGEMGVRGWITALDVNTGKIVWRAYSTGPDSDVLIGPQFKPFYPMDQGKDLGVKTWPSEAWKTGGGTVWGWISYDPETNMIFYGTGNPGPWNADQRPGDNKWSCTLFARDADTGQARWAYQIGPHDIYDYDGINESILLDLQFNGKLRKVLVRPERDGYVYLIDRTNGEVLYANPYGYVNSTAGVDLKTGRQIPVATKATAVGKVVRDICPAAPGTKDWQPSAFSPQTGLVYITHQNLCMDFEGVEANYIAGTPFVGANVKMYPGPGGHRGEVTAWNPVTGKPVWKIKERFPVWSGALATAGDLVFYGTMDGWAKALDAKTGAEVWKFKVGSGIIAPPMTYRGPDGRQYVAFLSGVGGWAGAVVSANLDTRDATAALGFAAAMTDLKKATTKGGMLYVFSL